MSSNTEYLRQSVIVGWISLLNLRVVLFVISLTRAAIKNDFTSFAIDPGYLGMNIMIVVFALHALIPVLVSIFQSHIFRWFIVIISVFFLLFFTAHEFSHLLKDDVYLNMEKVLELTHLAISLWVVFRGIQWARVTAGRSDGF